MTTSGEQWLRKLQRLDVGWLKVLDGLGGTEETEDCRQRSQRQQRRQLADHETFGGSRHQQIQAAKEQQQSGEVQPSRYLHTFHGNRKGPIAGAGNGGERSTLQAKTGCRSPPRLPKSQR